MKLCRLAVVHVTRNMWLYGYITILSVNHLVLKAVIRIEFKALHTCDNHHAALNNQHSLHVSTQLTGQLRFTKYSKIANRFGFLVQHADHQESVQGTRTVCEKHSMSLWGGTAKFLYNNCGRCYVIGKFLKSTLICN